MRPIKFREWLQEPDYSGIPSYMNYHPNFQGDINTIFAQSGVDPQNDLFATITYMQFTGLTDKNGVEIYESDIVRWDDTPAGMEVPVRTAVVKFDPDICFFSNVGVYEFGNFAYKETEKYLTVLGNVFENPELLEVRDE